MCRKRIPWLPRTGMLTFVLALVGACSAEALRKPPVQDMDDGAPSNDGVDRDSGPGWDTDVDSVTDSGGDCVATAGLAGHYVGFFQGNIVFPLDPPVDVPVNGSMSFDLAESNIEFYDVTGTMRGETPPQPGLQAAHFTGQMRGEVRCDQLSSEVTVTIDELAAIELGGVAMAQWTGTGFANGIWSGSMDDGGAAGSGSWCARPEGGDPGTCPANVQEFCSNQTTVEACDAVVGCAYFYCSSSCWPKGTALETACPGV